VRLRPVRDYVWIRPRPELIEETSSLKFTFGELSEEQQAIVQRANTVGYIPLHHLSAVGSDYKSHPDSLTFGEVLRVGPGRAALAQDRPGLRPGDLVSYKRNRVAHEFPDFEREGGQLQLVHEHGIPLRYPNGAGAMPEPLADTVITRPDPDGAKAFLGKELPLTPEELAWGIVTKVHKQPGAHRGTRQERAGSVVASKTRLMVERVVATGPGRWVQAVWSETEFGPRHRHVWEPNEIAPGPMALFLSCNDRARFRLHGETFTLAPWQDFVGYESQGDDG